MPELLSDYLFAQWQELLRLRKAVLQRFVDQDIHDLRVTSRRLRVLLDLIWQYAACDDTRRLRRRIRRLTRELGQLRNIDEAGSYLEGLDQEGLAPLLKQLRKQRRKEARRVRLLLEDLRCKRLTRQLHKSAKSLISNDQGAADRLLHLLAERSQALYQPINELLPAVDLCGLPDKRHRLRIAIKKWRYFNELLAILLAGDRKGLLGDLKRYQTLLGDLNDRELFLSMIRNCPALSASTQQQVEALVAVQHKKLLGGFRRLLKQRPLQYQFSA